MSTTTSRKHKQKKNKSIKREDQKGKEYEQLLTKQNSKHKVGKNSKDYKDGGGSSSSKQLNKSQSDGKMIMYRYDDKSNRDTVE